MLALEPTPTWAVSGCSLAGADLPTFESVSFPIPASRYPGPVRSTLVVDLRGGWNLQPSWGNTLYFRGRVQSSGDADVQTKQDEIMRGSRGDPNPSRCF